LRQQLRVLQRQVKRPKLTVLDRAVLVIASATTSTWRESMLLVKPEAILHTLGKNQRRRKVPTTVSRFAERRSFSVASFSAADHAARNDWKRVSGAQTPFFTSA
jgi:hypothetical protein